MWFRWRFLVLAVFLFFILASSIPATAQTDDYAQIYQLARQLHYEDAKLHSYTGWINGDMGLDVSGTPGKLRVGMNMPKFTFNNRDASTLTNTDVKPPYIINMWASWCPPCRDEFPLIADNIDAGNLKIPVVFVDAYDDRSSASIFMLGIVSKVNIAYDERKPTFVSKFGIDSIPQTILVGKDGKIAAIQSGGMTELSLKFFTEIAAHPGIGAFDNNSPDKMPPEPTAPQPTNTPIFAPTTAPTSEPTNAATPEPSIQAEF